MVKESAQLVSEQWRIHGKDTGGRPPYFYTKLRQENFLDGRPLPSFFSESLDPSW